VTYYSLFAPIVFAFVVTFFATSLLKRLAIRHSWLDEPNQRSSHSTPTPKSGGVGFGFAICMTWIGWGPFIAGTVSLTDPTISALISLLSQMENYMLALISATVVIAMVGLVDDRVHLSPRLRLVFHFLCSALVLFHLPAMPVLTGLSFLPDALLFIVIVIAMVWFINLFNFMDGIDGIAVIEALSILLGMTLLVGMFGRNQLETLSVVLPVIAALVAFLWWNWAPAKIFMGDAGSGFLGLLLPGLMLLVSWVSEISLLSIIILSGVFVMDATVTLLRRFLSKQQVSQAHRSHTYQILSRRWQSHSRVSLAVAAINFFWLLPLSVLSQWFADSLFLWVILVIAWAPLGIISHHCGAGLKND
jgi:Fuc2NAc and GlcNAc transferase